MKQINLQAIPNQSLDINGSDSLYQLIIKETNGVMSGTVIRNGVTIVANNRIVAGTPIIPFKNLQEGNFIILTNNYEIPYYTEFNVTQFLFFVAPGETLGG